MPQIEVHVSGHELRLSVVDDGIGVAGDAAESGLRNVRRRAAGLGGFVELTPNETARHRAGLAGAAADPAASGAPSGQTQGPVTTHRGDRPSRASYCVSGVSYGLG